MKCLCDRPVMMPTLATPWSPVSVARPPMQRPPPRAADARTDLLMIDAGAKAPPEINSEVYAALALLRAAHSRAGFPFTTITSWWRSPTTNLAAGGVANSLHLAGLAFDLRVDAGGAAVARAWRELGYQIKDERMNAKSPHWHLEFQRAAPLPGVSV